MVAEETEIVQPFLLGCDTKSLRVVQISLTALQRLITNEALSEVCTLHCTITLILLIIILLILLLRPEKRLETGQGTGGKG